MPRKSRIDALGALHHIIVQGIERSKIFKDDTDRHSFLYRLGAIIQETKTRHGFTYSQEFKFDSNFELNIASKIVAFFEKAVAFDCLWIKGINGERAGSIAVSEISEQVAFINFLLVLRKFRGQGIAQELMNKAISVVSG